MDMEVAMDDAVKLRRDLVAEWEPDGIRVTYTDLVLAAATKALGQHPAMNSALQEDALVRFEAVHIGLAVALDEGLIVPVIKDAQSKSLKEIATHSAELATRARDGKLTLDEVDGGTFTVTSLGMYGVDTFTPILNPPQAGILGCRPASTDGIVLVRRRHSRSRRRLDAAVADLGPSRPGRCAGGGVSRSGPRLPRVTVRDYWSRHDVAHRYAQRGYVGLA